MNALIIILIVVIITGTAIVLFFCYTTYLFKLNDERVGPTQSQDSFELHNIEHIRLPTRQELDEDNRRQAEKYKAEMKSFVQGQMKDIEKASHSKYASSKNASPIRASLESIPEEYFPRLGDDHSVTKDDMHHSPSPVKETKHFSKYYVSGPGKKAAESPSEEASSHTGHFSKYYRALNGSVKVDSTANYPSEFVTVEAHHRRGSASVAAEHHMIRVPDDAPDTHHHHRGQSRQSHSSHADHTSNGEGDHHRAHANAHHHSHGAEHRDGHRHAPHDNHPL